jgi:4-amino-4-deoxy-L-arabinose transferase-like glycosyltransferase
MKIKNLIKNNWLIILVLLVAAVLRLWQLGSIPPGLTPDEASLGYNAYSILKTGRDEFGTKLPIIFKSFGDFKPGLYVYLDVPFVAALGLNEFTTRLPSAIFGVLSVYLIYLIVRKMFTDNRGLAIVAAIVSASNPYLIYFSRGAWEANVSLTFTLAGIYFFLIAIEKKKYLLPSSALFALSLLIYQGAKLSTAIVVLLLVIIYWKQFWQIEKKCLYIGIIGAVLISFPAIMSLFNGQTQRLTIFSVFSYPRPVSEIQTYSDGYFNLFHSDQLNHVRMVMSRWFNFYSGQFLVFEGDVANPVHTAPYQGILLLVDLMFLPIGLFFLFKNKISKENLFIFLWLILAPFSAAISRDQTNAVRSLNASIPLVLAISIGASSIVNWISKQKNSFLYYTPLSVLWIFSFVYFLDAYFVHLPAHNSNFWRYGYREAVNYVTGIKSNYKTVVFEQSFNQPYIYFLFYQRYDPAKYQTQANLISSQYKGDVGFQARLDNIQFEQLDWSALRNNHGTLVVAGHTSVPPEIKNDSKNFPMISEIKYLNGRDGAFDIIEIK